MGGQRKELVVGRTKRQPRDFRDMRGSTLTELRMRIEAGANGSPANCKVINAGQSRFHRLQAEIDLRDPATYFLPQCDGGGVLQMGAPGLDHTLILMRLGRERVAEFSNRWDQMSVQFPTNGNMHGGREGIVRGLPTINVVIGVSWRLAASHTPGQFDGPIRDDLIDVHVGLSARAGLKYHQWKLVI